MIDTKICDWLMDNADALIRYRVARELLKDKESAKKIEPELFEHKDVKKWIARRYAANAGRSWLLYQN